MSLEGTSLMLGSRTLLFGTLLISSLARAGTITLDFEGFADSTSLTNQYVDFLFTNASVWTAALSLNDLEFPPHSGVNVAADTGGPITIAFASPVLTFSGFLTYSSALTIDAFNSLNQTVGATNSAFTSNVVSSGNPANELLLVSFAGGISRVSITGDPGGLSFALDDATVTTPASGVPEPSSGSTVLACVLLVCILGIRSSRLTIR